MPAVIEAEVLISALQDLGPSRAGDVAGRLGQSVDTVAAALRRLEREGRIRMDGAHWSIVAHAPSASASPRPGRTFAPPDPVVPPAGRAPVRRIVARLPEPKPAAPAARVDRRRDRASPKLALLDANRALLGTMPDTAVAARLGVSIGTIRNYRLAKGLIAASPGRPKGTRAVADRPASSPAAVGSSGTKLGTVAANHDRLGTMPDARLAAELGVSLATLARYRSMVGLPARKPAGASLAGPASRDAVKASRAAAAPSAPVPSAPVPAAPAPAAPAPAAPAPAAPAPEAPAPAVPRASSDPKALSAAKTAPVPSATPSAIVDVQVWIASYEDNERTVVARSIVEAARIAVQAFGPGLKRISFSGEAVSRG